MAAERSRAKQDKSQGQVDPGQVGGFWHGQMAHEIQEKDALHGGQVPEEQVNSLKKFATAAQAAECQRQRRDEQRANQEPSKVEQVSGQQDAYQHWAAHQRW